MSILTVKQQRPSQHTRENLQAWQFTVLDPKCAFIEIHKTKQQNALKATQNTSNDRKINMKHYYKQIIHVCMTDNYIKPSSDIYHMKLIKYFTFGGLYV